ncbi:hypothetical protein AB6809_29425 [Paraburkholderia sp. RCC_158]|uniref:hypothetical protein n=1 Tax=Paraburkholderia sp. RCC_158 TaxID=3239220 RepID=UPI003526A566
MEDLRATGANETFTVAAPLSCLYEKGVEHTAGANSFSEPPFTSFINRTGDSAWFRQPLTLVELKQVSANETAVDRRQTGSASAFGQANDLLHYLKSNPCAS